VAEGLNTAQMAAVMHVDGPCLVLAGAGSGKTRVITHKIARLLQQGLAPQRIAAITFTNKAAAEMRERAKALVGPKAAKALVVCTFHALGVRLLREDGAAIGLKPNFSILDSADVAALLRDAGGTTDVKVAKAWQWQISLFKNQGFNAAQALAQAEDDQQTLAARVMARYEERLAAYQAVDFDDLIVLPLKLLREHEAARAKWQAAFGHVLIDEVQDTNAVQYALLKALVGADTPFTAVGDDDQSIYGWRGATLDNLRALKDDYPRLKLIALEQNYRSTSAILHAANSIISHNPKLFEKKLFSELGEGEPVQVQAAQDDEHEAANAVARIKALRAQGAAQKWSDFAVLYRANHQAKVFEQKLRAAQMPYRVSGGQSFFERTEIRDLCAWLRLIVNNDDDPAFLRAATTPKRGIGHTTLAGLGEFAGKWKCSLFEALFSDSLHTALPARAVASLHEFGREVNDLEYRARHAEGAEAAKALLLDWLKALGYEQHLHDGEDSAKLAAARWSNVLDFVDWIARRCGGELEANAAGTFESERQNVWQVAQTISLIASLAEREQEQDVVTLSTLHAAKGLEWPHVVLAGVNEGSLPFGTEGTEDEPPSPERVQEERRLMYVGITRARKTLLVSHVLRKKRRGAESVAVRPSRFIAEMKLNEAKAAEDPREKLKRIRAEIAARNAAAAAAAG
jgi:ATP-dependent DNA helicase Rep